MKKNIMLILLGMIITICIGASVYAINASEITYKESTLEEAIDDLYSKIDNNNGYAALFTVTRAISPDVTYIPVVYSNSNYVEEITNGLRIKESGNYKVIASSSHSANTNTTVVTLYVNDTGIAASNHSIVEYNIINETIALNEGDEIKATIYSDGNQRTTQGAILVLIKL